MQYEITKMFYSSLMDKLDKTGNSLPDRSVTEALKLISKLCEISVPDFFNKFDGCDTPSGCFFK